MSQAAAQLGVTLEEERVRVVAHFLTSGSARKGTKNGTCTGFEIELHLHSDEDRQQALRLFPLAHQMCYTEDALTGQVRIEVSDFLNGLPV